MPILRPLVILACLAQLAACGGNSLVSQSRERFSAGDSEGGLARLEQAMKENPSDHEARTLYMRERDRVVAEILASADSSRAAARWNEASVGYERVKRLAPGNARAEAGLASITAARRHHAQLGEALALWSKGDVTGADNKLRPILAEDPNHVGARSLMRRIQEKTAQGPAPGQLVGAALAQPITLEFRDASLKSVFEVISRTSGINFVFDKDVRGDTPVTIFVKNSGIDEIMKLILVTNQLERKVLNANTVLIYPNTPLKQKDYQELVVRSFYLANADVKQAMAMLKTMTRTKDLFADEKLNLLVMRDTPDAVRMAERLIEGLDLAEPEVMLEVEVLEVARNKLLNLGLQVPDAVGFGTLTQNQQATTATATGVVGTSTTLGGALAPGYTNVRGSLGVPFVANPAFMLNLHSGADDANILANPRIRVKNHEKAKIHIGERLPVFTTTSTANVGVSASVNYLDVGLKLEVEPVVYLEDDVGIKVGLEVSSVIKEVTGPQSSLAYEVGTRIATTTLRLRDGETQVLAGLINDEERSSALRIPGLGDLPMVGRLFSSTKDSKTKTEIVLLITPHVVRNIARPDAGMVNFPGGTESSVGSPPLLLSATGTGSLALSSGAGAPEGVPTPTVAPEGLPNAEVAPAAAAAAARATFDVPVQIAGGVEFPLAVGVSGVPGARGGKAEVAFDPTAVEVPGSPANGRLVMDLQPGPGGVLRGEARVKLIPGAGREVVFQAAEIRVEDAGGNSVFVAPPPPQSVKMAP